MDTESRHGPSLDRATVGRPSNRSFGSHSLQFIRDPAVNDISADSKQGHRYDGNTVGGSSKAHFGDVFANTVNYNTSRADAPLTDRELRWTKLKNALRFDRIGSRLAAIDAAHDDTCLWIFDTPGYLRWRDSTLRSDHHGIYWIKGKPGAGKSTIMKCMFERARDTMPSCTVISFFFNARGDALEQSIEGMYRSMLYQLMEEAPVLQTTMELPFMGEEQMSLHSLRELFRKAMLCLKGQRLLCFIDALDECHDQQEVRSMIGFLDDLVVSATHEHVFVDICFASRYYPNITIRHCEKTDIQGQEAHGNDIRRYITNKLAVEPATFLHELSRDLEEKSQGVFLWVVLVVNQLNEEFDRGNTHEELLSSLGQTPEDLDRLIHRIIEAGASDKYMPPALQLLLFGEHDFTVAELYSAIRLSAGQLDLIPWTREAVDSTNIRRFVLHCTKGLAEVVIDKGDTYVQSTNEPLAKGRGDEWTYVQFIHETVRQHLHSVGLAYLDPSLGSTVEATSRAAIAGWYLDYLRFPKLLDRVASPIDGWEISSFPEYEFQLDRYWEVILLGTVMDTLFDHIEAACEEDISRLSMLRDFPWREWNCIFRRAPLNPSASVLRNLLEHEQSFLAELLLWHHKSTLSKAHQTESSKVAEKIQSGTLIGSDIDEDVGGEHATALLSAVANDWIDLVKLLVECGADINARNGSALHYAIICCSPAMIELLLSLGARVNSQCGNDSCALETANKGFRPRETQVQQILLNAGADVNIKLGPAEDDSFLALVLGGPNRSVLGSLFLRSGAFPETCTNALLGAAISLDVYTIRLLLQHDVDPNSRGNHSRTALHIVAGVDPPPERHGATRPGQEDEERRVLVTQALIDHGGDVNAVGGPYDTALIAACSRDRCIVAQLLLENNANIAHRSKWYGTATDVARLRGNRAMVDLLMRWSRRGTRFLGSSD